MSPEGVEISSFKNEFYGNILENLPGAVIICSDYGKIIFANASACSLFDLQRQEFITYFISDIIITEDIRKALQHISSKEQRKEKPIVICKKKRGETFHCELSLSYLKNDDNKLSIILLNPVDLNSENLSPTNYKEKPENSGSIKKFEHYFNLSSIAMAIVTPDGHFRDVNQEMCKLLDYTATEIMQMTVQDITFIEDIPQSAELFVKMIKGVIQYFNIEKRLVRKSGDLIHVTASLVAISDEPGTVRYIICSLVDNTRRYEAEAIEHQKNLLLRTLIDNLPSIIYVLDRNGRKIISNKADLEITGFTSEDEVIGKTLQELLPDEIGIRSHAENLQVINKGEQVNNSERFYFLKKWNKKRLILVSKIPIYDENKNITGLIGFGKDITDVKELETKIRESEEYFRTLIDISPYGIVIVNRDGFPDYISAKAMEVFKIPQEKNIRELMIFDFLTPEHREDSINKFKESLAGVIYNQRVEYKCIRYDGSQFWAEVNSSPLRDAAGEIAGLMLVCQDITARKTADEELLLARDRAEQGERLTSAMLHNISHEIRTPLNAILGFSDLITQSEVSPESRARYIEIIHSSSDQLLSTINDLVDISAIQARIVKIENTEVNISEVMRGICSKFRMKAEEKNIRIKLNEPEDSIEILALTDKKRLIQIISNLVKNAIKFSGRYDIETGYVLKDRLIEFYVSDKGIGIAQEYHSKIFEPFYQVEYPEEIRVEGTGMGLALSKAYVELLGGRIWLNSLPGEGSVFYFTIPQQ
jgi:PAS domain S-box-containing protein